MEFLLFVILGIALVARFSNGPTFKAVEPCKFHDWHIFNGLLRCRVCNISPSDRTDDSL